MAGESHDHRIRVREVQVAILQDNGFALLEASTADACPLCGCQMGKHVGVLPGDVAVDAILDRSGWIECPTCDITCGVWMLTRTVWV